MTTSLTFTQALTQAEAQARSTLHSALHERLSCAVALVKNGAVFQTTGGAWQVQSVSQPARAYTTNGTCQCDDMHFNKPRFCKHQLAMFLTRRVQELLAKPPAPVVPEVLPEPWPDNDPEGDPEDFPEAPAPVEPPRIDYLAKDYAGFVLAGFVLLV